MKTFILSAALFVAFGLSTINAQDKTKSASKTSKTTIIVNGKEYSDNNLDSILNATLDSLNVSLSRIEKIRIGRNYNLEQLDSITNKQLKQLKIDILGKDNVSILLDDEKMKALLDKANDNMSRQYDRLKEIEIYTGKPGGHQDIIVNGRRLNDLTDRNLEIINFDMNGLDTGATKRKVLIITEKGSKIDTVTMNLGSSKGKSNKKKKIDFDGFVYDLGFNNFFYNNSLDVPNNLSPLKLNFGKSSVNVFTYQWNRNLITNHIRGIFGLGLESNNYRFSNNTLIQYNNDTLNFVAGNPGGYDKNKLNLTYLNVPVMVMYMSNPKKLGRSFNLGFGASIGALVGSKQKIIFEEKGDEIKSKIRDDFNINPIRLSLDARIGYGSFNFFVKYGLNDVFDKAASGRPKDMRPVAAGITFGLF